EQARGGRYVEPGAVAKAEPTESKLKEARGTAKLAMLPSVNAAMVIKDFGERFGDLNAGELAVHLKDGMNDVNNNNLRECEAMLYCQAHALQAIFVASAHRATLSEEWFPNYEAHMRIAMKAQAQCRAALETLAQIKNPPVVFARQANIAQGPQQVNNQMMPAGQPRARGKNENTPNELLEEKPHERLDTRTPGSTIGSDPAMATVGAINRAEDDAR
ncbi:MAG: hypothetical protein LC804_24345, partial [Acidobacteria bacterium]|nr:hypothetical protein [Acidobacteriota bacterium]